MRSSKIEDQYQSVKIMHKIAYPIHRVGTAITENCIFLLSITSRPVIFTFDPARARFFSIFATYRAASPTGAFSMHEGIDASAKTRRLYNAELKTS